METGLPPTSNPWAKLCFHSNARLRGTSNRPGGTRSPTTPTTDDSQQTTPTNLSQASQSSTSLSSSRLPPLPASPSLAQSMGMMASASGNDPLGAYTLPNPLPLWLNPHHAKHIVKGNFMTLSARPKTVEPGEWIAHQGNKFDQIRQFQSPLN